MKLGEGFMFYEKRLSALLHSSIPSCAAWPLACWCCCLRALLACLPACLQTRKPRRNPETRKPRRNPETQTNPETRKPGNPETRKPGNPEIRKPGRKPGNPETLNETLETRNSELETRNSK